MFAKFFSFYFLFGSLIPGTNFSDLVHIPDLLDHYQLHVEESAKLCEAYTLVRFINDHFINPDKHTQKDHDQDHKNLPLHNVASNLLFSSEYSMTQIIFSNFEPNIQFLYILTTAPGCEKGIFQPPI